MNNSSKLSPWPEYTAPRTTLRGICEGATVVALAVVLIVPVLLAMAVMALFLLCGRMIKGVAQQCDQPRQRVEFDDLVVGATYRIFETEDEDGYIGKFVEFEKFFGQYLLVIQEPDKATLLCFPTDTISRIERVDLECGRLSTRDQSS